MEKSELGFLLALLRFPKFGPVRLAKLRGFFSSMEATFKADSGQLIMSGLEPKIVEQFIANRNVLSPEKELALLEKHRIKAITFSDDNYPALLKKIYDPPAVLFVRGQLPEADSLMLAVVGSRKESNYGARAVKNLIEPLAASKIVIVSGLAYGIDALAHQAALNVGGKTLAVLGSSVDDENIFPIENRRLAFEIIKASGAIVSEFPVGSPIMKQNFPIRNRVIAGLCHGTLVIEAAKTSGALITARAALEDGREVFAVPGPIDSENSEGTNQIIKTGAHVVTEPNDILSVLNLSTYTSVFTSPSPPGRGVRGEGGSPEETELLSLLSNEPIHIDDLVRTTGKKISEISHVLTLMEMKGSARHIGGLYYTL